MTEQESRFETWAIVELMGHIKLAGKLTEEERFGTKMGRIDIPSPDDSFVTQYFGGQSVYRVTPCEEKIARAVAKSHQVQVPYELRLIERHDEDDYDDPSEFDVLDSQTQTDMARHVSRSEINPHVYGDVIYLNADSVIAVYESPYDADDFNGRLVRVEYTDGQVVVEARSVDAVAELFWGKEAFNE